MMVAVKLPQPPLRSHAARDWDSRQCGRVKAFRPKKGRRFCNNAVAGGGVSCACLGAHADSLSSSGLRGAAPSLPENADRADRGVLRDRQETGLLLAVFRVEPAPGHQLAQSAGASSTELLTTSDCATA